MPAGNLPNEVVNLVLTVLFDRAVALGHPQRSINAHGLTNLIHACNQRRQQPSRPTTEDIHALVAALSTTQEGYVTFEEFETWATAGLTLSPPHLAQFRAKGHTESALVDFLSSVRLDILGVVQRITASLQWYANYNEDETQATEALDVSGFAWMVSSVSKDIDGVETLALDKANEEECTRFILSECVNKEIIDVAQMSYLLCCGVTNPGLSKYAFVHGSNQSNCKVWALLRRKAYRIVDGGWHCCVLFVVPGVWVWVC
jgi:hypothetical protein